MSAGAHVTALRGPPPALRSAAPDERRPAPVLRPSGPLLPLAFARGVTFLALAGFGALHWMAMMEPTEGDRAWYSVVVGGLAMGGLLLAGRLGRAARIAAATAVAVVAAALAFLAAGIPGELLEPGQWDALAAGIGRGIDALPGARVPYRGIDEWTRLVIPLGGTVLTALAAVVAFWPRGARGAPASARASRARIGFPLVALMLLVTLYAVPAVALDFEGEFLRGALLALLVLAFLRLERLRLLEARPAAALAAATAVVALVLAPALDGDAPWWDYETWALSTAASRSTSFSWDHDYGPLDWPRDGREMLRVRARQPAYWKAQNLDVYDGARWRQAEGGTRETIFAQLPDEAATIDRWTQRIRVSVRNLRTRTFVTAGIPVDAPDMPRRAAIPNGPPGVWSASRALRRGDTYEVPVYTPKPSERELAAAGSDFDREFIAFRSLELLDDDPGTAAGGPPGPVPTELTFAPWGVGGGPQAIRREDGLGVPVDRVGVADAIETAGLERTWALSQRLRRGADTPFEYIQSVEAYLARGFSYTESPPPAASTLEGFLFRAKSGYCQQYSGAMALLLRMGGIPARVATGFTSGSYDRKAKEYVVRDLDAHSWVEAWFPRIGWVTLDPTPSDAPPRSQGAERGTAAIGDAPDLGGAGSADPRAGAAAEEGTDWGWIAAGAAAALALLVLAGRALWRRGRRGRRAPLPELERALRRARRAPGPGATLQALEDSFARSPAAAGYVRALREQRYGGRGAHPTRAQRRGLRAELGRGGGLWGRLRAWWALPPRPSLPSARRRTLGGHG